MPVNHDTSFVDNLAAEHGGHVPRPGREAPAREAFRYPVGDAWESVTWKQAGDRVTHLAAGLLSLGIQPEQRVGIASGTRYEWILADLAIMCAGGATTTVYPLDQRRGHGVHPQRLRVPGGLRRGRRAARQAHRAAQRAPARSRRSSPSTGTADGDWVITLDDLAELGEKLPRRAPRRGRGRRSRPSSPTSSPP